MEFGGNQLSRGATLNLSEQTTNEVTFPPKTDPRRVCLSC